MSYRKIHKICISNQQYSYGYQIEHQRLIFLFMYPTIIFCLGINWESFIKITELINLWGSLTRKGILINSYSIIFETITVWTIYHITTVRLYIFPVCLVYHLIIYYYPYIIYIYYLSLQPHMLVNDIKVYCLFWSGLEYNLGIYDYNRF